MAFPPHTQTDPRKVVLVDVNGDPLYPYVDEFSGAIGTIDQEHLKIHEGKGFLVSQRITIANVGGTYEFIGVVPALTFPHFRSLIVSSDGAPFDIDFYEGATYSAAGTLATANNLNRNSSIIADLDVYSAPTLLTDGTLLEPILVSGTKQSGALGAEGSVEWNLKPSETYLIRITNNTTGAGSSTFVPTMFWYE